jgi:hypothetical protein
MVNIFLDVNKLVELINGGDTESYEGLRGNRLVVSLLSWHIVCYLMRWKIPNKILKQLFSVLTSVEMDKIIVKKAMVGPTDDFEDNVQLHSAVVGDCDYFLTMDKKLLKMKYFGKMRISDRM